MQGLPGLQSSIKGQKGPRGDQGRLGLPGQKGEAGASGDIGDSVAKPDEWKFKVSTKQRLGLCRKHSHFYLQGEEGEPGPKGIPGKKKVPQEPPVITIVYQGEKGQQGDAGYTGSQGPPGLKGWKGDRVGVTSLVVVNGAVVSENIFLIPRDCLEDPVFLDSKEK